MNKTWTKILLSLWVGCIPLFFINSMTSVGNINFDLTFGAILSLLFFGLFFISLSANNEGILSFLVGSLITLILVSSFQIISFLYYYFFQYRELTFGLKMVILITSILVIFIISIITVWVSLGSFEFYDNRFKVPGDKTDTSNTTSDNSEDIEDIISKSKKFLK